MSGLLANINWSPTIGDPTVTGWSTVLLYLAASILCFGRSVRYKQASGNVALLSRFWLGVSILMFFLCINKQIDLQTLFTELARALAIHNEWYEYRRELQQGFILSLAAIIILGSVVFCFLYRTLLKQLWIPILGTAFLMTFVVIRAVSFYKVDILISGEVLGISQNFLLESPGIILIMFAAHRQKLN